MFVERKNISTIVFSDTLRLCGIFIFYFELTMYASNIIRRFSIQIVKRSPDPIVNDQFDEDVKAGLPDPPDAETIQKIIEILQVIAGQVTNFIHKIKVKHICMI